MNRRGVQTHLTLMNWIPGNPIDERHFTNNDSGQDQAVATHTPAADIDVTATSNRPSGTSNGCRKIGVSPSGLDVFAFSDDEEFEDARECEEDNVDEHHNEVAEHTGRHAQEVDLQGANVDAAVNALQALQINDEVADNVPEINPGAPEDDLPATRVYTVHSSILQGTSIEWSEAGAATQGPRAHGAVRLESGPDKHAQGYDAFVVYRGHEHGFRRNMPGVHRWTKGFFGAVYEGYFDLDHAANMHRFARDRGWLACDGPDRDADRSPYTPPFPVPNNWNPQVDVSYLQELNSILEMAYGPYPGVRKWYVVTVGYLPGVYLSLLEAQLNVIGVSGGIHHHESSLEQARRFFQSALAKNNVMVRRAPVGRRLQGRDFTGDRERTT